MGQSEQLKALYYSARSSIELDKELSEAEWQKRTVRSMLEDLLPRHPIAQMILESLESADSIDTERSDPEGPVLSRQPEAYLPEFRTLIRSLLRMHKST
jgi:hypothetical protein